MSPFWISCNYTHIIIIVYGCLEGVDCLQLFRMHSLIKRLLNSTNTSVLRCVSSASNRSSRKRDRFTVRPSDYISDSVTAPSSTATVCVCLLHTHTHTLHTGGSTCWLCCLAVDVLARWDRPAWVLSWGRVLAVVIYRHLWENKTRLPLMEVWLYNQNLSSSTQP